MIQADALILHLNPLQEAVQPEGDTASPACHRQNQRGLSPLALDSVPVIAKEVGWGISEETARRLWDAGVAAIDVAGAGGTSWSQVEAHRAHDPRHRAIAGPSPIGASPPPRAIQNVRRAAPALPVIASGGLRDGIDVAKSVALGASLCGLASPFLKAAAVSEEATAEAIAELARELRIAMFAAGAGSLRHLQSTRWSAARPKFRVCRWLSCPANISPASKRRCTRL